MDQKVISLIEKGQVVEHDPEELSDKVIEELIDLVQTIENQEETNSGSKAVVKEESMATLDDRFEKGLEMRQRLGGGQGRVFRGSVPAAYKLAPDMYRLTTECLYGSIWSRPGLDVRYRGMATLTASVVQLAGPQVRAYIRNALNLGVTPEEIVEILMMSAFYGGIPASYNALAIAKEVFEESGISFTASTIFDPSVEPGTLYERGIAKHRELMPDVFAYYSVEPTQEEHELDILMQEYLWGAIWTRPGLDMNSRIICALTAQVVMGRYDQFIRRMIEGALRNGITRTEIMELFMHLAFYVGILPARSAMNIANTVFRSPEFSISSESANPNYDDLLRTPGHRVAGTRHFFGQEGEVTAHRYESYLANILEMGSRLRPVGD